MKRKILSALLASLLLMTTIFSTSAFAVEETQAENTETKIYFEAPDTWGDVHKVYCHLYTIYGGKEIKSYAWSSNSSKCELVDAEKGIYSFDTAKLCLDDSGVAIVDGADYGVIFHGYDVDARSYQTVALTFGSDCLGDTAYVTGDAFDSSPSDDIVYVYTAAWKNNTDKYGYRRMISSTGKIIDGTYLPVNYPKDEIVAEWLHNWAVLNQSIINPDVVANIVKEVGIDVNAVYDKYAQMYADELKDIANYPDTATLEKIRELLGIVESVIKDVNGDSSINVSDATAIMKYAIGLMGDSEFFAEYADVNGDGVVNVIDATLFQKCLVGATE